MVAFGILCMLIPAGTGTYLAWQNRNAIVQAHVGNLVWTGHLYGVLIIGALLACWFLLGAAFIQCRIAELRQSRAVRRAAVRSAAAPAGDAAAARAAAATTRQALLHR
jgi:hypothetical protein